MFRLLSEWNLFTYRLWASGAEVSTISYLQVPALVSAEGKCRAMERTMSICLQI